MQFSVLWFHQAQHWHERVYGLACLCVDLELLDTVILEQEKLASKGGSGDPSAAGSHKAAKDRALALKAQAKHPVFHAYRMYASLESKAKEWIIATTTKPLERWYHEQSTALKGVSSTFDWLQLQCKDGYWKHILETFKILDTTTYFNNCGVELDFEASTFEDDGLIAHVAQQDEFASYIADMLVGIVRSRLKWGLDFIRGFPRRLVLLASESGAAVASELRNDKDVLANMTGSTSPAAIERAARSHLNLTYCQQLLFMLQRADWIVNDAIVDKVRSHFLRVESTKIIEEGLGGQKVLKEPHEGPTNLEHQAHHTHHHHHHL